MLFAPAVGGASDRLETIIQALSVTEPALAKVLQVLSNQRIADISNFCDGRLTLSSGVPYEISQTVFNGTTLYFTPYVGSRVSVYNGTRWEVVSFSEISATPTLASSRNYDVFVYNNSGTLALEFSAPWTTDTVRADALSSVAGVLVKAANTSRRYVGTVRTGSGGLFQNSQNSRFLWNQCNRKRVWLACLNSTFHSYDGPYRLFNATNDFTTVVTAVVGQPSEAQLLTEFSRGPTATSYGGIGLNTTSAAVHQTASTEGEFTVTTVPVTLQLGIGLQTLNMINSTNSTGSMDVYFQKIQGWMED